jgi:cytochrome b subunit of formate dehydrogenase
MFGIGAISAPFIKERTILLGIVGGGIVIFIITGTLMGWNQNPPPLLSIPVIQDWIFAYPAMAGSRALMIGISLGIIATSFRIIIGLDKSFLGDK